MDTESVVTGDWTHLDDGEVDRLRELLDAARWSLTKCTIADVTSLIDD